eukprot:149462_1
MALSSPNNSASDILLTWIELSLIYNGLLETHPLRGLHKSTTTQIPTINTSKASNVAAIKQPSIPSIKQAHALIIIKIQKHTLYPIKQWKLQYIVYIISTIYNRNNCNRGVLRFLDLRFLALVLSDWFAQNIFGGMENDIVFGFIVLELLCISFEIMGVISNDGICKGNVGMHFGICGGINAKLEKSYIVGIAIGVTEVIDVLLLVFKLNIGSCSDSNGFGGGAVWIVDTVFVVDFFGDFFGDFLGDFCRDFFGDFFGGFVADFLSGFGVFILISESVLCNIVLHLEATDFDFV